MYILLEHVRKSLAALHQSALCYHLAYELVPKSWYSKVKLYDISTTSKLYGSLSYI